MLVGPRVIFAVVLVLLLSACGVRLLYSHMDWLVPRYVGEYVTLDARQRALLAERLGERLNWHCEQQLPAYSTWLRGVSARVSSARLEQAELERYAKQAEAFVRELLGAVVLDVSDILAVLADEQVEELFVNLEQRNDRVREEYLDAPAAKLRTLQVERMEKRLRRWLGPLSREQRRLVEAWSTDLTPIAEEWVADRIDWQRELKEALRHRHNRPEFDARIAQLLLNPDSGWSAHYRAGVARNRELTLGMFADLHALSTPRQRSRLLREIESLTRQFDRLACDDASGSAPTQARVTP